jgi:hypothetical protein
MLAVFSRPSVAGRTAMQNNKCIHIAFRAAAAPRAGRE